MIDRLLDKLARFFFEKTMRAEVEKRIEQEDREAGLSVAARYTRGNVAIQQKRIATKKIYQ